MIASRLPAFAKLGPKLDRAGRVRHNYGFDLDAGRTEQNRALMQATFPKFVAAVRALEHRLTGPQTADDPAERS